MVRLVKQCRRLPARLCREVDTQVRDGSSRLKRKNDTVAVDCRIPAMLKRRPANTPRARTSMLKSLCCRRSQSPSLPAELSLALSGPNGRSASANADGYRGHHHHHSALARALQLLVPACRTISRSAAVYVAPTVVTPVVPLAAGRFRGCSGGGSRCRRTTGRDSDAGPLLRQKATRFPRTPAPA